MSITTIITHLIAFVLGIGGGWYVKGRWGSTVAKVEADIKKP